MNRSELKARTIARSPRGASAKAIRTDLADLPGNQIHMRSAIMPYGIAPITTARTAKRRTLSQGSDGLAGSSGRDNAITAPNAYGTNRQERKKVRGFNCVTKSQLV